MILDKFIYKEYHQNGELWITGEIIIVSNSSKHLYNYLTNFPGAEGKNAVRVGIWRKYYDNGQLAYTLNYGDGTISAACESLKERYPQYRRDGSIITY